jgi:hypothetical protein
MHDVSQELERLCSVLNLIENILRFQVLTNSDTLSVSICESVNEINTIVNRIPVTVEDFNEINQADENGINGMQKMIGEMKLVLLNVARIAGTTEQMIKFPVRTQMKSLAGIRKFTIPRIIKTNKT